MLLKARREGEEEAREAWFFLFGIIHIELRYGSGNGTAELMELVNALDAFVQGSPVGQYEERLALLTMFSRSCRQRKQRGYDEVSKALGNLARYYGQFQPAIDDRVAADLKPLEKELADFVKLAKWEDRGFYAMKASAEKAHSQLCKIIRKAKDALGTPASACLRVLAGDIGIDAADKDKDKDIASKSKSKGKDKEKHGSAKATHGTTSKTMQLLASLRGTPPVSVDVPPSSPSSVHLRPAESNLLVGIVEVVLLKWRRSEPTTLTRGDPPSFGLSVSHSRHALRSFARSLVRQGKYSKRIHDIAGTFQRMVKSKEDAIEGICDAVSQADGLSTAALEQAIALKNDVSKGAKSRKKKALADFFKALEACGISKLQTAVGVNDRDPRRWMTVDFEGVSDSSYYYESIARLNRLREVSQQPHQDVQAREIHMANNMMTHAVHRVQETRWVFISADVRSNALTLSLAPRDLLVLQVCHLYCRLVCGVLGGRDAGDRIGAAPGDVCRDPGGRRLLPERGLPVLRVARGVRRRSRDLQPSRRRPVSLPRGVDARRGAAPSRPGGRAPAGARGRRLDVPRDGRRGEYSSPCGERSDPLTRPWSPFSTRSCAPPSDSLTHPTRFARSPGRPGSRRYS